MKAVQVLVVTIMVAVANAQFKDNALAGHNQNRALHEDTKALVWNEDVARFAQNWCDELAKDDKFEHSSGSGYGENLYWSSRVLVGEENAVFGTAAVTSWYGESADWNYATSSGAAGKVTGHFTQVVWKGSTAVGCAYSISSATTAKFRGTFVCCNYKPPGNYIGEYAANVGQLKGTETCEWEWKDPSACAARGKDGKCYQGTEQECSCEDATKCTGSDKEATKIEECKCEETCKWEWKKPGNCTAGSGDMCYQITEQECSCSDESKCNPNEKLTKKEICECEKKCEWEWSTWSKCTSKDPNADVQICTKARRQMCSCMSSSSSKTECDQDTKEENETEECKCGEDDNDYEVRLVGGKKDNCGILAIGSGSNFSTVCDDWWGDKESNAACRHMGYKFGSMVEGDMFDWPAGLGSFAWTEADCPAKARALDECVIKDYLSNGTSPCQQSETVALKCCDTRSKFDIEMVQTMCNKKRTKCKFGAQVVLQKQCVDLDQTQVKVEVWHKKSDGTYVKVKEIKYKKNKGYFMGTGKISRGTSDCFIYKAQVAGFGGVMKSSGNCDSEQGEQT